MSIWTWHGLAGHLIVADKCCFHLHTTVGDYRVSTIGCYHPEDSDKPEEIGAGRLYETMVFNLVDGEVQEWMEIDSDGYNDGPAAEEGHLAMCDKYDR